MIHTCLLFLPLVLAQEDSSEDRLDVYANGRMRAEGTFDQLNGKDRFRGRMRGRIGARYLLTEGLTAEGRLSTSSDGNDANNPYWDFGDGDDMFQGGDVVFDRFLLDYRRNELNVQVGKMADFFRRPPVLSEMVWDYDVAPTGVAASWKQPVSETVDVDLRVAEYIAVENSDDDDSTMFGVQCVVDVAAGDGCDLTAAASFSNWSDLGAGASAIVNQGNTDPLGDFEVVEGFVAATIDSGSFGKTTAFAQFMHNVSSGVSEDTGFALGASVGRSGQQGDVNVFGGYYDVDADAFFSAVAQDDTPIAGTGTGQGMKGFIGGAQYFWRSNVSFKVWALTSDAHDSEDPFRLRFDIDFKVL